MIIIGLYAGLLGILYIVLSYRISSLRRKHKVGLGDGGINDLQQAIRAHANYMEYVPLCLILLVVLAANGADIMIIHISASILVFARVLHFVGLTQRSGTSFGRLWGTVLTWLLILFLSGLNIYQFLNLSF